MEIFTTIFEKRAEKIYGREYLDMRERMRIRKEEERQRRLNSLAMERAMLRNARRAKKAHSNTICSNRT